MAASRAPSVISISPAAWPAGPSPGSVTKRAASFSPFAILSGADMTDKHDSDDNANRFSRRAALVRSTTSMAALACALSGCATSSKKQGEAPKAEAQYQE